MLIFSDMTLQLFAQNHTYISTQGPLIFFTYSNALTCMPSYSYSHFKYGFEDVGKDQTTMYINYLQ